ncbi:MAG: LuxR C-terminal-related transcriptional regulator [Anaerolineae bacterium]
MADPSSIHSLYRLDYSSGNETATGTDKGVRRNTSRSLLLTKLQRPPLPPDNVARPRLVRSLRLALDYPMTLVSAPTGYGKSTLVAQALAEIPAPAAWLSVDEFDNDLVVFLDYLIAAIQTQFPNACTQTRHLLEAVQVLPVETIAASFLNELQAIETPFVVVIDDVHHLSERTIGQLFATMLRALPTPLHLVAISQSDPPWPIARLAAKGRLLELRGADLRFRLDEAKAFLDGATGKTLPEDMVEFLVEHTEGWIVALRLAALNLNRASDRAASLSDLKPGAEEFAPRALVHEMLARQTPAARQFLLRTSILDRLSVSLCTTIMEPPEGNGGERPTAEQIRGWLMDSNLFIVPLDQTGEWYRYHQLFGGLLRRELATRWDAECVKSLHRQASAWFDERGFAEEALRHALAAGDTVHAAEIVESQVHARLNREDWRGVEHSLSLLPEDLRRQRPVLLLAQAFVLALQEKIQAILPLVQAAASIVADPTSSVPEAERKAVQATLTVLRAYSILWRTPQGGNSLDLARQAQVGLPRDYFFARSAAYYTEAIALYLAGRKAEAIEVLRRVVEAPDEPVAVKARAFVGLATIYRVAGSLPALEQTIALYLKLATDNNLATSFLWARYFLGSLHYERNELQQAIEQFEMVVEQGHIAHYECVRSSLIELALAYQAQGQTREADAAAGSFAQIGLEFSLASATERRSLDVRLALVRQDVDGALRGAAQMDGGLPAEPMLLAEIPAITRAQALLSMGGASERRQALTGLAELESLAEDTYTTRPLVRILALQALGLATENRDHEALVKLEHAVNLAEPMGLIRTFVDVGPTLAPLLNRLYERRVARAYLRQVLSAFQSEIRTPPLERLLKEGALVEPLTNREMEILRLLGEHMSNKEIAMQLVVAPQTVKRHTGNIFGKLGVHSRREAVSRAQALGILPLR